MIVYECTRFHVFSNPGSSPEMILFLINSISNTVLKALLVGSKVFTSIIYTFQNIMLYLPFFFREHKKALSRWFLLMSLAQFVGVFCTFMVWSMILIYSGDDNCEGIVYRSNIWKSALSWLTGFGYIASLLLSIPFTLGYYRNNSKAIGRSQAANIKKTMISCSIEILFDISVLVAYLSIPGRNCFTTGVAWLLLDQMAFDAEFNRCDMLIRLMVLDGGISVCALSVLVLQQTLQELFYLVSVLVDHCLKESGATVQ